MWGERGLCLLIGESWAPGAERDEGSAPTTVSRIKIERFIPDAEQGLLILSEQTGYRAQGDRCCRSAEWGADADADGAGGALARLTQTTNPAGARVHSPEEERGDVCAFDPNTVCEGEQVDRV